MYQIFLPSASVNGSAQEEGCSISVDPRVKNELQQNPQLTHSITHTWSVSKKRTLAILNY